MPGWLRRPGGNGTHQGRAARLRDRVGRLRGAGIQAQVELHKQFGSINPDDLEDPRLFAQLLQDERMPRAIGVMRARAGRLWEQVDALAAADGADDGGLIDRLEAETDDYERQIVNLRAWFVTRAAVALGMTDLSPASPVRRALLSSAALDRSLLPLSELIVRCDLFSEIGDSKAALEDAAAAAARPEADHRAFAVHGAALELADRPADAAIAFRRAYEASPDRDPDLLLRCGQAQLSAGCHQDALDAAEAILEARPTDVGALALRADALRFLTRFEEAETAYRSLLALPDAPDGLFGLLQVLAALGRSDEVEAIVEPIRSDPDATPSRKAFGCYFAHRYIDAAAESLHGLADPGLPPGARRQLERLRTAFDSGIGCPEQALEGANAILARDPGDADLEATRGIALADLGRFDEAIASSRRALSLIDKSEYDGALARALRWSGDPSAALPLARRCQSARPRRSEGIVDVVCCLIQLGDLQQAREAATNLLDASGDPWVLYTRAALAESEGDREMAARLLDRASGILPELGLHAVIDPVFHDGAVLDEARRARLRSLIDANVLRRAGLAQSAARLDPGDAMVIRTIAATAGLETPREVSHWLYFGERRSADDAAAALRSDGYEVTVERSAGNADRWLTRAVHRIAISPETIAATRASMERLATRLGGEYDGWEAAVER